MPHAFRCYRAIGKSRGGQGQDKQGSWLDYVLDPGDSSVELCQPGRVLTITAFFHCLDMQNDLPLVNINYFYLWTRILADATSFPLLSCPIESFEEAELFEPLIRHLNRQRPRNRPHTELFSLLTIRFSYSA